MKKLSFILFLCLYVFVNAQEEQSKTKILFIGNSYTATNNLPLMFSNMANSVGDSVIFMSSSPGGVSFQNHLTNNSMSLIAQGNWDYVILQEQSQLPAFPISQVEEDCFPYAARLVDSIRKYNTCVKPIFYMTWGRKNGDQNNCANYPPICTYEGMDDLLYERYTMMADDNNSGIAPVGAVWRYIRTNYPHIELYTEDGSHPSLTGTYAAACTFYTTLFKKSVMNIDDDVAITDEIKNIVKNSVNRVVLDSISKWTVEDIVVTAGFNYEEISEKVFEFENISENATDFFWDFGDGTFSDEENPVHEYENFGTYQVKLVSSGICESDFFESIVLTEEDIPEEEEPELYANTINAYEEIICYPNPVKDILNINADFDFSRNCLISIYSENGQKVLEKNVQICKDESVDISHLLSGIYIIEIISEDNIIFNNKIVKM